VPTIIVRQHAILATVLHIRALIKADTVVVFDVVGSKDSRLQSGFVDHLVVRRPRPCWWIALERLGPRTADARTLPAPCHGAEQPQDAADDDPLRVPVSQLVCSAGDMYRERSR
jgi:hypothetical protein